MTINEHPSAISKKPRPRFETNAKKASNKNKSSLDNEKQSTDSTGTSTIKTDL